MTAEQVHEEVQEYYGTTLKKSSDLKTNACCTVEVYPAHIKAALGEIHGEVLNRYYGCGLTIPSQLDGARVLDLGSGAGRDCFILSKLVGEKGRVVGIDMTDEQLEVAQRQIGYHTDKFGYATPNVEFRKGFIEHLDKIGLEEESFDLIVSNCVVNLAHDKKAVMEGAYRLLKPGGEFYFSDVYGAQRVPEALVNDRDLYGECLSGAMYWNDFGNLARKVGFIDPRFVESSPITVENAALSAKLGHLRFHSITYRLFKLPRLEPHCEDYGQAVQYRGTIAHSEPALVLDAHHEFPAGEVIPVCGNTYRMLHGTRYRDAFDFYGTWDTHYGIFEGCGVAAPFGSNAPAAGSSVEGSASGSSCC